MRFLLHSTVRHSGTPGARVRVWVCLSAESTINYITKKKTTLDNLVLDFCRNHLLAQQAIRFDISHSHTTLHTSHTSTRNPYFKICVSFLVDVWKSLFFSLSETDFVFLRILESSFSVAICFSLIWREERRRFGSRDLGTNCKLREQKHFGYWSCLVWNSAGAWNEIFCMLGKLTWS